MSWLPGPDNPDVDAPTYTTVPTIRVVDGAPPWKLHPEKKAFWREARDRALSLWSLSGLRFPVVEARLPKGYPFVLDSIGLDLYKLPEGVNGMGDYVPPPTLNQDVYGAGYAVFGKRRFGALYALHQTDLNHTYAHRYLAHLICHEVGHALGFAHGGTGVMAGAWRPNVEELAALRDYYGLA
jgi:hypothetical protein